MNTFKRLSVLAASSVAALSMASGTASASMVGMSYGAHYDSSKCHVANATWKGHHRFYLNNSNDYGCFSSGWFKGEHPIMLSFGKTVAPWYPSHFHHGVDVDMAVGTPVYSAKAWVVLVHPKTMGPAYGTNGILVRSGGYDYVIGHMSKLVVRNGQKVAAGTLLGYSGMSGAENEDGPHIHLEVRPAGTGYTHAVNPYKLLGLVKRWPIVIQKTKALTWDM